MRVLLVEDDLRLAAAIRRGLRAEGIVVDVVGAGSEVVPLVRGRDFDAVVLDVMLPGLDGFEACRALREQGDWTPVIMLTARDKPRDKVRNLDLGADDYLTKPFDIEELLARVRAVLRRVERDEVLRAGNLEVNTATRQVRRGTRPIELTAREFDLLEALARNARRVLPRDLLLEKVWSATPDADPNVVDVYIGYLRKKIDLPGEPRLIQTVRGAGFALRER